MDPYRSIPFQPKEILDFDEVYMLVNLPRSRLATEWKRAEMYDWARRLDAPAKRYEPRQEVLRMTDSVLLPGDKCPSCKKAKAR